MKKEIIEMNSVSQNELLVWNCLHERKIEKFNLLLESGMPLTAFMLTCMTFLDYSSNDIKEVLPHTDTLSCDAYQWVRCYFADDELSVIMKKFDDNLPLDYPSNDDCIKLKLWKTLLRRGEFGLIAQNAPEVLEIYLDSEDKNMADNALRELLIVNLEKYADLAMERRHFGFILYAEDGWKYLFEHGKENFVIEKLGTCISKFLPMDEIFEYCREKGWVDGLYKAGLYDLLLKHKRFELFVANHSLNNGFLTNFPEEVDWEGLWEYYHNDEVYCEIIFEKARLNRNIPKCKKFLSEYSGIRGWFKSHF